MVLLCMLSITIAGAQDAPPAAEPDAASMAEQIAARLTDVEAELARVQAQIAGAGEPPPPHLAHVESILKRIELVLGEQNAALQLTKESSQTLEELNAALVDLQANGPPEPAPYSILVIDSVRNELQALRGREATLQAGIEAAAQAREEAVNAFEQKEAARRQAKERRDSNDADIAALTQALSIAELASRLAAQQLELRKLEAERQKVLKETYEARVAVLEARDTWMSRQSTFSSNDLRTKLVEFDAKEATLKEQRDLLQIRLTILERQWIDARQRLESKPDDAALVEEVNARRLAFQVRQREIAIITRRLQRIEDTKELWQRRYEIWRSVPDRATLSKWDEEARVLLEALDSEYALQELEFRDIRQSLVSLQERLDTIDATQPNAGRWIRDQIQGTQELDQIYETNAASIESARLSAERLLSDISAHVSSVGFGERLAAIWDGVVEVWRFEITSIDDRPITIGKVIVGLILLILGFFAARWISAWLGRRLLPRVGFNEGAAAAVRSVIFYVLLISFVFIALRTINIPLTAFTILGGAVAIGVGFGSQNIMNNFMSGLILIAERPIRVGDLVQIGDLYGVVQHLGARSTRILTGDNIEIIVPNSSFLENNVINWTLSETRVRIHVSVGVAYGSPVATVTELLQKASREHKRVLNAPAPIVLFDEFGDNSLVFEVHFWIVMRRLMDRRIIESEVRYSIDELFRDAGIVIAFPQRDVHLDASRPLNVRVLSDDSPGEDSSAGRSN